MKRKFTWLLVAAFAVTTALAGCGKSADTSKNEPGKGNQAEAPKAEPKKGGILNLVIDGDPEGLNPYVTNDVPSSLAQSLIYATVLQLKSDGSPMPVLVEKLPDVSADGLTYTYKLKKDLKWSDGKPLTADDVVFTVNSFMDKNLPGSPIPELWAGRKIEKVDDLTFKVILPEPAAGFLVSDSLFQVLPKHVLGTVPVQDWPKHESNKKPTVFSGPFKLETFQTGQSMTLVRNDNYALGAPNIEKVAVKIITEQTAAVNALLTGEVDFIELTADTVDAAKGKDNIRVYDMPDLGYFYIGYNLGTRNGKPVPFFQDKNVRIAIAHAVNKEELTKAAAQGQGVPVNGPIPPVLKAWYNPDVKAPEYNPEKAKQLLDAAGWKVGADGVREKDGVKFSIKLPVRAGKEDRIRGAQVWAQQLEKVGIKVEVTPEDFQSVMLKRLDPPNFDYDAIFMGWGLTADPDQYQLFHSSQKPYLNDKGEPAGGSNYFSWKNDEADKLILDARKETDPAKRKQMLDRIQQIMNEDPPYYFLWSAKYAYGINKRIKGPVEESPWGYNGWGIFWNIEQLWIE